MVLLGLYRPIFDTLTLYINNTASLKRGEKHCYIDVNIKNPIISVKLWVDKKRLSFTIILVSLSCIRLRS